MAPCMALQQAWLYLFWQDSLEVSVTKMYIGLTMQMALSAANLKAGNSDTDASEELSCPVSDVERHVVRNRNAHDVASSKARVRRAPRLTDGLSGQSARHIRRFWCYRTPSQTLLFVRLRAGKLYCMYMNRSGKGEGARWVVRKIEGEEYGALSEKLKNMAHAMDY